MIEDANYILNVFKNVGVSAVLGKPIGNSLVTADGLDTAWRFGID